MRFAFSIIALAAACSLLSGCGCSSEKKPVNAAKERMVDVAYTNKLITLHGEQKSVAAKMAAIQAEIEKLGENAKNRPEYADLTNKLAKCELESKMIREAARQAVRERLMKNLSDKGNLKK